MVVRGTTSRSGSQIVEMANTSGRHDRRLWRRGLLGDRRHRPRALLGSAPGAGRRRGAQSVDPRRRGGTRPRLPRPPGAQSRRAARSRRASTALTARLFGNNPYAWDPVGLRESLERMDRSALIAHYRRHYVPGGMVLAVSGHVKATEVIAQAKRLFGQMPRDARRVPQPPPPPAPTASREVLTVPGAQAQILMGALAPSARPIPTTRRSRCSAPCSAAAWLDASSPSSATSRAWPTRRRPSIRRASTPAISWPCSGRRPPMRPEPRPALAEQLDRVQRQTIADEELRSRKEFLLGRLAMDRRTNARQAWYLAAYEQAGVAHDFLDRFTARCARSRWPTCSAWPGAISPCAAPWSFSPRSSTAPDPQGERVPRAARGLHAPGHVGYAVRDRERSYEELPRGTMSASTIIAPRSLTTIGLTSISAMARRSAQAKSARAVRQRARAATSPG